MSETMAAPTRSLKASKPAPKRRLRRTDVARLPFVWAAKSKSKEGELYRAVIRQLTAHLGDRLTPAYELLVARIAWLQVHLAHIDERAMRDGGLSPHAVREYLAWGNALARMIGTLGLEGSAATPQENWRQFQAAQAALAQPDDEDDT